jgi:predicted nucleic acid-binding protein
VTRVTVLDASILIAAMHVADAHHFDAVTLLRRGAITGVLVAHSVTVAESAVGAAEHGRLGQLRSAYEALGIEVSAPNPDEPWRLALLRSQTRLPIPDCCVLDTAESTGGQVATFDHRLAAAARARNLLLAIS